MILTDYYKLERLPKYAGNRVPRFDTTSSSKSYRAFEEMAAKSRDKCFFCYYNGIPDTFSDRARENAERAISHGKHISSVFIPDLQRSHLGFGDVKGSNDAILFLFSKDYSTMELFIARGYKSHQRGLYNYMIEGKLANEMKYLRDTAR